MGRKDNAAKARALADAGYEVIITFKERTKPDGEPYLICLADGRPVAGAAGGGYCRRGSCLGDFVNLAFPDLLMKLDPEKFYGLSSPGIIDGARGEKEVESILDAVGYSLKTRYGKGGREERILTKKGGGTC